WREGRSGAEAEAEAAAAAAATGGGGRGGSGPFLYISATPRRRQNLQNASSNCLWVLERTHCALGGRPLRGSCSAVAAALAPQQPQGANGAAWSSSSAKIRGANSGSTTVNRNRHAGRSSGSHFHAAGAFTTAAAAAVDTSSAYSSGGDSGGGGGSSSIAERRRQRNNADFAAGNDGAGRIGGGVGGAGVQSSTHPSSFFASGGGGGDGDAGRDTYAEAVAKRRRRQGAGDAVEYVRIKHLATMRYLCVGKDCDPAAGDGVQPGVRARASGTARTQRRGDSRKRGAAAAAARVGMLTVDEHAAVPTSTVFVIRPRTMA
ncbi:unnamed protein product, partial [Scytosiphon promiscuus]